MLARCRAASIVNTGRSVPGNMHSVSLELLFWYGLAFKMVLTASVVVITSLAVERSGPFVGALIGALPTAAGAAYTILALEHPPSFIAASAVGSVAVNAAVADLRRRLCGDGAAPRPGFEFGGREHHVVRGRGRASHWSTGRRSAPSCSTSWCSP